MNAELRAYRARAKAAIDQALEHRPDAFRVKVLEMTLKNHWDVNDPAFLILLSTGEMRVLMEEHPAQFEALMNRVFKLAEGQFLSMHEKVMAVLDSSELAAQALERRVEAVRQLLQEERSALVLEHQSVTQQVKDEVQQQVKLLDAKAMELTAKGFAISRQQATEQVQMISQQLREVYQWEAMRGACVAVLVLFIAAWAGGWFTRGIADKNSLWGDVERWNRDHLKACIQAKQTTCNFHIQVPNHPLKE